MQGGVLKQPSTMYLKFIESGLKMFLGSVADVFYILTVLCRRMFLVFENARWLIVRTVFFV